MIFPRWSASRTCFPERSGSVKSGAMGLPSSLTNPSASRELSREGVWRPIPKEMSGRATSRPPSRMTTVLHVALFWLCRCLLTALAHLPFCARFFPIMRPRLRPAIRTGAAGLTKSQAGRRHTVALSKMCVDTGHAGAESPPPPLVILPRTYCLGSADTS